MKLVGSEFCDRIQYYTKVWMPARDIVKKGINERYNVSYVKTVPDTYNKFFKWEAEFLHGFWIEYLGDSLY